MGVGDEKCKIPVKSADNPEIDSDIELAACPLPFSFMRPELFPAIVVLSA
jgi:hypothetical protein